ncbi:O-antigen ligase family protein [Cohnella abietis]|uniref:O-antigen ligase-related domain-containing protein n=1 Tax=Cohnella abietis TaxID=2507935 RepID=A0A3T1DA28_9BACL|nr:O-antigen ligase family protein [Cohnella abietis]BBI34967.1 hypothetical protein KCTCHS21_43660 [Cohnella abietis]
MERNGRLESTLEYANTLAIILLVALIVALLHYAQNGRVRELVVSTILVTGLLLTLSRSVWVLWFATMIILFFIFSEMRRKKVAVGFIVTHIAGWLLAAFYKGDLLFFKGRVQTIQPETSEFKIRLVYWKDGLQMLKDYWWKGTGGGGWNLLQQDYQSQPYFVKYIHNHFLQTALDIGIYGLLLIGILVGLFIVGVKIQIKKGNKAEAYWGKASILVVIVVILHSGFDFDLTFPIMGGILLLFMSDSLTYLPVVFTINSKKVSYSLVVCSVCITLFLGWSAIGYKQKQVATQLRDSGQLEMAEPHFRIASGMIPWSHTIQYENAKLFVLQGNISQNKEDYKNARTKVEAATKLQPKESLYKELLDELKGIGNRLK